MPNRTGEKIVSRNFSAAFDQMCNFVAVSKTGDLAQTLEGLVQVCLLRFAEERFTSADQISETIDTIFGLTVPPHQIQLALDALEKRGVVSRPAGTNLALSSDAKSALAKSCRDAEGLEQRVKAAWLEYVSAEYPDLPSDAIWVALRKYLGRAFRRHGLQTVALVDPAIQTPSEYEEGLTHLLDEVLSDCLDGSAIGTAREAISDFFVDLGSDSDRSRYITQLADGAFNFFSLQVSPELARRFKAKLTPLVLFLDTNFLFGILKLHYNQQVDVSHDLVRAIADHRLPFTLRYHDATQQELRHTIRHHAESLRRRSWTTAMSRAAAASRNLSGIEQRFHERNAGIRLDVDEFLRPYEHFDVLLKDQGIEIYRSNEKRLQERTDLYHEYKDFLERHGKGDKAYETIQHDATLLDAVRLKRGRARSSLEAGALLVSCDYLLYRFDWATARRTGGQSCVVLPNAFWQILRPYIPTDHDFDKSFAETFALPEFRALGSGGSKACSRMLSVLASYRDVPEDTAEKLLSNDVLLDKLRTVDDDGKFREAVDSAIVEENASLLEEKAATEDELASLREERREQDANLKESESEKAALANRLAKIEKQLDGLKDVEAQRRSGLSALAPENVNSGARGEKEESVLDAEQRRRKELERQLTRTRHVLAGVLSLLGVTAFLVAVHWIPWVWLRDHPTAIALQVCFSLIIALGVTGICVPKWRKRLWGSSGLVALVFLVLSLIDV